MGGGGGLISGGGGYKWGVGFVIAQFVIVCSIVDSNYGALQLFAILVAHDDCVGQPVRDVIHKLQDGNCMKWVQCVVLVGQASLDLFDLGFTKLCWPIVALCSVSACWMLGPNL